MTLQYCGALGKVANCQAGVFLAHVGPRGLGPGGQAPVSAGELLGSSPLCEAGVPEAQRRYRAKTGLALALLRQARARGSWRRVGCGGRRVREVPGVPRRSDGRGDAVRLGRSAGHPSLAAAYLEQLAYHGRGRPPQLKPRHQERLSVAERSLAQPKEAWREVTVAEGAQGPRTYRFSAERIRETRNREPGGVLWAVYRQNLDGSQPRYYFSNAPEDTPLETLARVGGSRWPIETEFETEKSDVGLDEYETRTWAGWHHHITLACWPGRFC